MNGAEALVETMLASGVDVCFANPGTSEMHFVAALDRHPEMRCVLCLFEGGATGAADAYYRMSGKVAGTLLHLGPGFANGWSNLHNARKGGSGIVNVVGDHAGYHLKHDAPLQSDLNGVAGAVSHWMRRAETAADVAPAGADAIRAAREGRVATLVLPADSAWGEAEGTAVARPAPTPHRPDRTRVIAAVEALRQRGAALLVGGPGLYGPLAETAARIAARTGCRLVANYFAARAAYGEGAVAFEQMAYAGDRNAEFLADLTRIVCVGANPPVNFFAYPGKPSTPEPPGCALDRLCPPDWDTAWTLETLAETAGVDGSETIPRIARQTPELEAGPLTPEGIGRALARHLPEGAIISNEAVTAGVGIWPIVNRAAPHDRINTTGGSIGFGLPGALGAAVACPDRPVYAVSGDGSAMYQLQVLWTMARERLDVTVIVVANRGYQILHGELEAQGAPPAGRNARAMFDIEDPLLDWTALAAGMGVPGHRATTEAELAAALDAARETEGPTLIEAVV